MKTHIKILLVILELLTFVNIINAHWEKTNGPWGATTVSSFSSNKETICAGSESKGVFLSTDQGESWKSINSDLPDTDVLSLLVKGDTIYAGTYNAIFISTNNGENWNYSANGIPHHTHIYSLAVFDTILLAGTNSGGIYRSNDNGENWTRVFSGISSALTMDFVENDGRLFAVVDIMGIFISNDFGLTWQESLSTLSSNHSIVVKDGIIFSGNLFISSDNGDNWETSSILPNENIYDFVVLDSSIFAGVAGYGVFVSNDNGENWKAVNEGLPDNNIAALYSLDTILFVSTYKGVFRSFDYGMSWHPVELRYSDVYVNSLLAEDGSLYAATLSGIFRSTDHGNNWIPLNSDLTSYDVLCLASNDTYIFAGTRNGVFKSTNDGLNWIPTNSGLENTYIKALTESESKIFLSNQTASLFVSEDNGDNWVPLTALPIPVPAARGISCTSIRNSDIFVGTLGMGIYRSTDRGLNWDPINNGLTDLYINTLYIDKNNLYAGTFHGFFLSIDNGENWQRLDHGSSDFSVNSIAIYNDIIFVGAGSVVYASTNNGTTWINTGIQGTHYQPLHVTSLSIQDSFVFAGTYDDGIWYRPISDIITAIGKGNKQVISQFTLSQNYPNPFNPTTNIKYSIPQNGYISLKVFNLLGQEVATLFEGYQTAGNYTLTFDAEGLASGVYLYRLKAANFVQTKKLILLR